MQRHASHYHNVNGVSERCVGADLSCAMYAEVNS